MSSEDEQTLFPPYVRNKAYLAASSFASVFFAFLPHFLPSAFLLQPLFSHLQAGLFVAAADVQAHFGASFFAGAAASSAIETETAITAIIIITSIVFILNLLSGLINC